MPRERCFIKISGDLCRKPEVLDWIKSVSEGKFTVICVGGGTQINEAFKANGMEIGEHGPLGRETKSFEERQLARDVLEVNQREVQDLLESRGIYASVVIPVLDIATVLCHVNGDIMVMTAYLGFHKLYVATTLERLETKRAQFAHLPKVEVVAF